MTTRSLAQFLLERGAITNDMLLEALEYQHETIDALCETAVKSRQMTREKLEELKARGEGPKTPEEEAEIRERIESYQQLEASWRSLSERGTFLVEALVRKGYLTQEQMDDLYKAYRQESTPHAIDLEQALPNQPETREILQALIDIALEIFSQYTKESCTVRAIKQSFDADTTSLRVFRQDITGDLAIGYAVVLPSGAVSLIAGHILGAEATSTGETAMGVLTEMVNIIVGNTCAKFSMRNYHVQADVPRRMSFDELRKDFTQKPIVVDVQQGDMTFHLVFVMT